MVINSPNSVNLITAHVPGAGTWRGTPSWRQEEAAGSSGGAPRACLLSARCLPHPAPRLPSLPALFNAEGDDVKPAEDVPAFMRRVWGVMLAAVLPLWRDPALLAAHGDKIVQVGSRGWWEGMKCCVSRVWQACGAL